MIDYTQAPIAYLVRVSQADELSLLYGTAPARAEEAARFLSYEAIGPIVSSPGPAAVETAETIFGAVTSTHAGIEVDDRLAESIATYLCHREAGPPCVLVCDLPALRAALHAANVCDGEEDLVAPGGIVSIHRDPAGAPGLVAIARHMIMNWKFADLVAMAADEAQAGVPVPHK